MLAFRGCARLKCTPKKKYYHVAHDTPFPSNLPARTPSLLFYSTQDRRRKPNLVTNGTIDKRPEPSSLTKPKSRQTPHHCVPENDELNNNVETNHPLIRDQPAHDNKAD